MTCPVYATVHWASYFLQGTRKTMSSINLYPDKMRGLVLSKSVAACIHINFANFAYLLKYCEFSVLNLALNIWQSTIISSNDMIDIIRTSHFMLSSKPSQLNSDPRGVIIFWIPNNFLCKFSYFKSISVD